MRWAARPDLVPPEMHTKRTVRRFAFVPVRVDEEEETPMWVWLECYYAYQEYSRGIYTDHWVTISRFSQVPA